jgi:hypothetical protein
LTDVVRVEHDAERIQLLYAGRARAAAARKAPPDTLLPLAFGKIGLNMVQGEIMPA